jgi:uncharacterized membrane protein
MASTRVANGKERLARGLGWFSIGLGLAEVLAPRRVAKLVGAPERESAFRAMGIREITSGLGILTQRKPSGWLWSRVGGDALDLAFLSSAWRSDNANRRRLLAAGVAVAGVTALDLYCSQKFSRSNGKFSSIKVEKSITINRSPEELYQFWRNFETLPVFMTHLESVQIIDERRSHWVAKAPAGFKVEWDALIINEHPNQLIAWRSVEGSDVDNAGTVRFEKAHGGRGTLVRVKLDYNPPAGEMGAAIAKLFGEDPEKQVHMELHRFKQLMETGEIATTEGQSAGRTSSTSKKYDDFVRT